MKKLLFAIILFTIMAGSPAEAASHTETLLQQLQKSTQDGYRYHSHEIAQMNQSKMKEVVVLFNRDTETNMADDYLIKAYEWKNGKWNVIYKREYLEVMKMKFLTSGKLGGYDKVVLGKYHGIDTENIMAPITIGSPDGNKIRLLASSPVDYFGNAIIKNDTLYVMRRSIVMHQLKMKNGKLVRVGDGTGKDDRYVAGNPKYWVGVKGQQLLGPTKITMKVGEKIGVGRYDASVKGDYLYTPYAFLKNNAVIEWDERRLGFIAKQKGTATIELDAEVRFEKPDVFHAGNIKIQVTVK